MICLICFVFGIILINYNVLAQTGIVTGKSVRLREKATIDSKILTTMSKNQKVEIVGEEENWYNITVKSFNSLFCKILTASLIAELSYSA